MTSSRTYISVDVAVRSLAVGVYRLKSFQNMDSHKATDPCVMNENLDSIIEPILMRVVDINQNKKTKETTIMEKAKALKSTLINVDEAIATDIATDIADNNVTVLIEYQLNANHGANAIFNMIVYHYAGRFPIESVKPAWKNTITVHPQLSHSSFLGRASSNYQANKFHTKMSMLFILTMIDRLEAVSEIAQKNLDDIADTLMQCLAYHKRSRM